MQGSANAIEVANIRSGYDATVIGAGPAGCGAAACLAARGASVLLVESAPSAATRFAGEWIHPEGARVLDSHGLLEGLAQRVDTRGFLVWPNDGLGPIELGYPDDGRGFACEHSTLVRHLRRRVASTPRVDYVEGVRAKALGTKAVALDARGKPTRHAQSELVVIAAGRSARGSAASGIRSNDHVSISMMVGLLIPSRDFVADGFGHVIVGGPGPALAYRVDERRVRLCIDVPYAIRRRAHDPEWLWDSFAEVLPLGLREGVRKTLSQASLSWAANVFRPRRYQAGPGIALVGDAAGVFHPLTAMGITTSLLDGEALAGSRSLSEYAETRAAQSYVPELLSNAIYQAFARDDVGAAAIRHAIFKTWRRSPAHRHRTMRLLSASSTSRFDFFRSFLRVALDAGAKSLVDDPRVLGDLAAWLRWPLASLHPEPSTVRSRSLSWAAPDAWARRGFIRSSKPVKEKQHAN